MSSPRAKDLVPETRPSSRRRSLVLRRSRTASFLVSGLSAIPVSPAPHAKRPAQHRAGRITLPEEPSAIPAGGRALVLPSLLLALAPAGWPAVVPAGLAAHAPAGRR